MIKKMHLPFLNLTTIQQAWALGLIITAILLCLALWGNWLIYKNFVMEKQAPLSGDQSGFVFLKKSNIINAGEKLEEHNAFLENPTFGIVGSPF